MLTKNFRGVTLLLFVFQIFTSFSQIYTPKYSNEFLAIGIGARAFGMSNVQSAAVNDVTSAYWNPAGLQRIKTKYDIGLMHAEYFAGIAKYDYAGFATRLDSQSVIAASIIRFGIDDIPDTRYLFDGDGNANGKINYNNIRFFSAADYAFLVSYARKSNLIEGLNLGVNLKIINRTVGSFATAWGFGFDVGGQYKAGKWELGLVARDITGTFNAWSYNTELLKDVYAQTNNMLPKNSIEVTLPRLIPGVARNFKLTKKIGLLAATDLIITFDGKRNTAVRTGVFSIDPAAGLEFDYMKIVYLRFGVGNIQRIKGFGGNYSTSVQPNFGLGVKVSKFTIDYALTDLGDFSESLYSNVFSLKFSFDKIK
ncbi:PorV/PorQ family protein [Cytophaga hutchinsonii]|uniref:putative type IX sorting system protein PorV2 n=1 Tax=Cytophaga hutchinsonii TaxID=985 RepID=UPI000038EE94|nr:PorV/PorQ family protein [Cytophaga hutchinsonii]SFX80345.1 hypothetical protein SAMN04487930_11035 [Cytophaga hutchinsonii ATCC 33406]